LAINENNICNIIVETCTPCNVTLEHDNILGIMEIEEEELISLTDNFISSGCQDIHNRVPKVKAFQTRNSETMSSPSSGRI
jgi:hypothetical protein